MASEPSVSTLEQAFSTCATTLSSEQKEGFLAEVQLLPMLLGTQDTNSPDDRAMMRGTAIVLIAAFMLRHEKMKRRGILRKFLIRTLPILAGSGVLVYGSSMYFESQGSIAYVRRYHANLAAMRLYEARLAEALCLVQDLDEKAFYERETPNLVQHRISVASLIYELNEARRLSSGRDLADVDRAVGLAKDYGTAFSRLVGVYRERGYAPWGIEGKWAEIRMKLVNDKTILTTVPELVLRLQGDEHVYLVNRDHMHARYIDAIFADMTALGNKVTVKRSRDLLRRYGELFSRHAALEKKIGVGDGLGLRGEMQQRAQVLQEVLEILRTRSVLEVGHIRSKLAWLVLFVFSISLGLEIIGLYYVTRAISRPIARLTQAALNLQSGGKHVPIASESDDEVGVLTQVFNETVAKLVEKEHLAEERATEAQCIAQELQTTQQQLAHSQKLEAIGTLAGGIAHDFNNILGGILGYTSHLKRRLSGDAIAVEQLSIVERSAERGADLTKKLLGFARKGQIQKVPLNLNRPIEESLELLKRTLPANIKIAKELGPDLWLVEGDGTQFVQAVMNLAINARDAMANTGGELRFETRNVTVDEAQGRVLDIQTGRYVVITISDTGAGIPKEIQNKIFDPFFTTKEVGKGSGLGLAMVYGIVKGHRGAIRLGSDVGQGAKFDVYVPAIESIAEPSVDNSGGDEEIDVRMLAGRVVLVVDDDPVMQRLAKDILDPVGAILTFASNGAEAVAYCARKADILNCIVLDLMMPVLGGTQAFSMIRKTHPSLPVLFASGYAPDEQLKKLITLKGVGFIHKPYSEQALFRALVEVMR